MELTLLDGKVGALKKDLNVIVSAYLFDEYPEKTIDTKRNNRYPYLDGHLKDFIDEIDDSLFYLLEYPYTDKLYRDSYYNYLSTINKQFGRDCIRVSLFSKEVKSAKIYSLTGKTSLNYSQSFLGFMTIRPSYPASYERSFFHPSVFNRPNIITCQVKSISRINGLSFTVNGFPHASQDAVYRSCAETTLWLLMEYFGTKYEHYGTILPSHIHRINKRVSFQRSIPSSGMGYGQIGYALRKLGFGSISYTRSKYSKEFNYIINDYIESGIPIIAISKHKKRQEKHAVLIIGHSEREDGEYPVNIESKYVKKLSIERESSEKVKKENQIEEEIFYLLDSLDCVNKDFVVMDDNRSPYQLGKLKKTFRYYGDKHFMSSSEIDAIIVPLYPKIYLDIYGARVIFKSVITNPTFGYRHTEKTIISRILLTSSKSFRKSLRNNTLNKPLLQFISTLTMPKFIYLIELSTPDLYPVGKGIGFILIDSTSSMYDSLHNSLLAIVYPDKIFINSDGYLEPYEFDIEYIKLYKNNLDNF